MNPTYWYLDPTIGSTGAYVAYNALTQTASNNSANGQYIQAGQAFFVQNNNSTAPSLVITEADKAATSTKTAVFANNAPITKINIELWKETDSKMMKADAAIVVFNKQFNDAYSAEDAVKFNNQTDNLSIINNDKSLSIDGRKPIISESNIRLGLAQLSKNTSYQLKINLSNMQLGNMRAYLSDAILGTTIPLNGETNETISFTVNSQDAATLSNRFSIVFKSDAKPTVKGEASYNVYPNPIVGNTVKAQFSNVPTGNYSIVLRNMLGMTISESIIAHDGAANFHTFSLGKAKLASGIYDITILNSESKQMVYTSNIMVK